MIELDYYRWGFLKSKLVYFADHMPATQGYHFLISWNGYSELPVPLFSKKYEKPTVIINLNQSIDDIYNQLHKNKRKIIRRGSKFGFELIKLEISIDNLKKFQHFYNRTIVKRGATPILSLNYFKSISLFLSIYCVLYKGYTLSMLLFLHDEKIVRFHYMANNPHFYDDKVLYYLGTMTYWEAIKHFKHLGYNIFDFGGLEPHHLSPPQGYTAFKLSFGGQIVPIYNYEAALTPAAKIFSRLAQQFEYTIRKLAHRKIRS